MRWYHFDPFAHMTPEQAAVGALRKNAEGHDVSIRALSKHDRTNQNFDVFLASSKILTGNTD